MFEPSLAYNPTQWSS